MRPVGISVVILGTILAVLGLRAAAYSLPLPGYVVEDAQNRPTNPIRESVPVRYHVELKGVFQIRNNPGNEALVVTLPLPPTMHSQKILNAEVEPGPTRIFTSRYGYRFAEFDLGPGYDGQTFSVSFTADVEIARFRYNLDPNLVGTLDDIPAHIRSDYTANSPYYQIESDTVKRTAAAAIGSETNAYLMARRIWDYVRGNLRYRAGRKLPADKTLRAGYGTCTGYAFSMIALCRSVGLPARYVGGSLPRVSKEHPTSRDRSFHKVVEIYIPNYGWIPAESSLGANGKGAESATSRFGGSFSPMLKFFFEPEGGLLQVDPRNNILTIRPSDSTKLEYSADISAKWTYQSTETSSPDLSDPSDTVNIEK